MKRTTEQIKAQHAAARAEMDQYGAEPYYLGLVAAFDWLLGTTQTSPITATENLAPIATAMRSEFEAEADLIGRPEHLRPGGHDNGWLNAAAEALGWALGLNAAPLGDNAELRPMDELRAEMDRLAHASSTSSGAVAPDDLAAMIGATAALQWLVGEASAPVSSLPADGTAPSVDDVVAQLELVDELRQAANVSTEVQWGAHWVGVERALTWSLEDSVQPAI